MIDDETIAAIYAGAERHNVGCTKVVVTAGNPVTYRVYIVTNERQQGQRRQNKWTALYATTNPLDADDCARNMSDPVPGAHYLGRGPA